MKLSKFSKRQLLVLIAFGIADFCNAICVSLQAPFFPDEANKKGASATEYGFVFGVFELVVFFISPWYGKHVKVIGPKRMFYSGILTSGLCSIFFGLLDYIQDHIFFISSAFLIRIIEAMGNAAFLTASFAIIANEFPDNIATTFASLETFFGLGLIAGPTLGGVLYEIGGYKTPFIVLGGLLFVSAIFTKITLPVNEKFQTSAKTSGNLMEILRVPGIPVCGATILSTSTSISFFQATLEPHLRQFQLTPIVLGLVFIVTGATYGASAPVWGWLCDNFLRPKLVSIIGGVILIIGMSLVGPAIYIPLQVSLTSIICGLFLHGLAVGARLVSSFTDAMQTAVSYGLPNDIETYGLISGLWTSSFALGAFIGPTVSGILYDNWGFADASLFIIGLAVIMVIVESISLCSKGSSRFTKYKSYANIDRLSDDDDVDPNLLGNSSHVKEKIFHSSHQSNVGIGSNRMLNLLYSSQPDLTSENEPLLVETVA